MKKLIALVLALSLVAGLSASSFAAVKKVVKKTTVKKVVVKKKVVKPVPKKPVPVKPAPFVPPAPAPVAPAPAPAPKVEGMGMVLGVNAGLDAGLTGVAGNLDYDLSSIGAQGFKVRVGGNYISGTNPTGNDSMKAVSLKLGALYSLTDYLQGLGLPLTYYVGGAYVLPVKVDKSRTGKWGAELYLGVNYSIPDFGMINGELGYSALKYTDTQPALKGVNLKIGYRYAF